MKRKDRGFPYDAAPDVHQFRGVPQDCFDLVNRYGTYNIQPNPAHHRHGESVPPDRAGNAGALAAYEPGQGRPGASGIAHRRERRAG